ncbi:MAG: tandem-95 repeat protein, partial [Verrucomicrobiales bacterium]|nr:tandem-95 repeat protein [Verrucomicrobiales bacterium]
MKMKSLGLLWCLLGYWMSLSDASAAFTTDLQGQSKGDTNWVSVNLQGWQELDYIPIRVRMSGGPVTNRLVTVDFDHSKNSIPGLQNLTAFSSSPNVIIKSSPTLTDGAGAEVWTYHF